MYFNINKSIAFFSLSVKYYVLICLLNLSACPSSPQYSLFSSSIPLTCHILTYSVPQIWPHEHVTIAVTQGFALRGPHAYNLIL